MKSDTKSTADPLRVTAINLSYFLPSGDPQSPTPDEIIQIIEALLRLLFALSCYPTPLLAYNYLTNARFFRKRRIANEAGRQLLALKPDVSDATLEAFRNAVVFKCSNMMLKEVESYKAAIDARGCSS